jgi:hypothetical protein
MSQSPSFSGLAFTMIPETVRHRDPLFVHISADLVLERLTSMREETAGLHSCVTQPRRVPVLSRSVGADLSCAIGRTGVGRPATGPVQAPVSSVIRAGVRNEGAPPVAPQGCALWLRPPPRLNPYAVRPLTAQSIVSNGRCRSDPVPGRDFPTGRNS